MAIENEQNIRGSGTKNRGFASMKIERQREIARKGGKAAHEKGTAHEFTPDEARAAGRKGGERVSSNRGHMAEIGRLGGRSSAGKRTTLSSTDQPAVTGSSEQASPKAAEEPHAAPATHQN